MLRLATDEDFYNRILRGVLRRRPGPDIACVQDANLPEKNDPDMLEWVAREGRVLLSHDVVTMRKHAYDRPCAQWRQRCVLSSGVGVCSVAAKVCA
jgi:hypothetical protein